MAQPLSLSLQTSANRSVHHTTEDTSSQSILRASERRARTVD